MCNSYIVLLTRKRQLGVSRSEGGGYLTYYNRAPIIVSIVWVVWSEHQILPKGGEKLLQLYARSQIVHVNSVPHSILALPLVDAGLR